MTNGGGPSPSSLPVFDKLLSTPPLTSPANSVVGADQWLRIRVPTKETILSLGMTDPERSTYTGFGVTTEGHIFASAGGRMTLESEGHMVVQSTEGSVYFGSPSNALLGSSSGMVVGCPGGVMIHGGGGIGVASPQPDSRNTEAPDLPDAAGGAASVCGALARFWAGFDGSVAAFCVGKGMVGAADTVCKPNVSNLEYIVGMVGTTSASLCAGIGFSGATTGGDFWNGTVVHGDSGVIAGSPAFASVFGGAGVTIGSLAAVFMGANTTALCGVASVSLESSKAASVQSNGIVEVLAWGKMEVSARGGDTHFDGQDVAVGGAGYTCQKPAKAVSLGAKTVSVSSEGSVCLGGTDTKKTAVGGRDVACWGNEKAVWSAGKKLASSVSTSHILMLPHELTLGIGPSVPEAPAPPDKSNFSRAARGQAHSTCKTGPPRDYTLELINHCSKLAKEVDAFLVFKEHLIKLKIGSCTAKGISSKWEFNKKNFQVSK